MRTVKPDPDIRVVDYLYDDLPEQQREAFAAHLDADEDAASEVGAYHKLLQLYRDESEELTPSVAASEQLLAQARRATQPWYARIFGESLSALLLRPAVGMAAMAVLVIGIGVFVFLSGRGPTDRDKAPGRAGAPVSATSKPDKLAEATATPAPATAAERGLKGRASGKDALDALDGESDRDEAVALGGGGKAAADSTRDLRRGEGRLGNAAPGALEKAAAAEQPKKAKRAAKGKSNGYFRTSTLSQNKEEGLRRNRRGGGRTSRELRLATKRPADKSVDRVFKPAPPRAAPTPSRRSPNAALDGASLGGAPVTAGSTAQNQPAYKQGQAQTRTSAPALLNAARTELAKGRVAQACALFASLVRQYRGYTRRADALLGWARCEMSRGAYSRAETILKRLAREHRGWQKAAQAWIAEVHRQRQLAQQRASQRRRARSQRQSTQKPARARPKPTSTSR